MTSTTESVRISKRLPIEGIGCRVYLSADQENLTGNSWNLIAFNTANYDLGGNFALDTYKFTVPVAGLYIVKGAVSFKTGSVVADKRYVTGIYKNGALVTRRSLQASMTGEFCVTIDDELYLDKDDYIQLYAYPNDTANTIDLSSGENFTYLIVRLVTKRGIRQ